MYVCFIYCFVSFLVSLLFLFLKTIYIRVPQRTDPFNVHPAFAVLEPV